MGFFVGLVAETDMARTYQSLIRRVAAELKHEVREMAMATQLPVCVSERSPGRMASTTARTCSLPNYLAPGDCSRPSSPTVINTQHSTTFPPLTLNVGPQDVSTRRRCQVVVGPPCGLIVISGVASLCARFIASITLNSQSEADDPDTFWAS